MAGVSGISSRGRFNVKDFDQMFGSLRNGTTWSGINNNNDNNNNYKRGRINVSSNSLNNDGMSSAANTSGATGTTTSTLQNGLYKWYPPRNDYRYGRIEKERRGWLSKQITTSTTSTTSSTSTNNNTNNHPIDADQDDFSRGVGGGRRSGSARSYNEHNEIRTNTGNSMRQIASLQEHQKGKEITTLCSSVDSSFFVSGSKDGTLKVWHPRGSRSMLDGAHRSVATHRLDAIPVGTFLCIIYFYNRWTNTFSFLFSYSFI
jgi:WD40 repeat protein